MAVSTACCRLIVWCRAGRHQVEFEPARLAPQYGADTPVLEPARLPPTPLRRAGDPERAVQALDRSSRRQRTDWGLGDETAKTVSICATAHSVASKAQSRLGETARNALSEPDNHPSPLHNLQSCLADGRLLAQFILAEKSA